jgi:hypothetical protein
MHIKLNQGFSLWLLVIIINAAACIKLPVEKSFWNSPNYNANEYSGYDYKSKLKWKVSNDSSNFLIILDTYETTTKNWILHNGIRIFLDTSGTGNKNCFLSCTGTDLFSSDNNQPFSGNINVSAVPVLPRENRNKVMVSFKQATWNDGKSQVTYDLIFEKTILDCKYSLDTSGILICQLGLPLKMINHKGLNAIKNLAVGIEIGKYYSDRWKKYDENNSEQKDDEDNRIENGMRNRMGGGMGMGRTGTNHGGMNGAPVANVQDPVNIWFVIKLDSYLNCKPD